MVSLLGLSWFWNFFDTFILEFCEQDFSTHVQTQSSHLVDELGFLSLKGFLVKNCAFNCVMLILLLQLYYCC